MTIALVNTNAPTTVHDQHVIRVIILTGFYSFYSLLLSPSLSFSLRFNLYAVRFVNILRWRSVCFRTQSTSIFTVSRLANIFCLFFIFISCRECVCVCSGAYIEHETNGSSRHKHPVHWAKEIERKEPRTLFFSYWIFCRFCHLAAHTTQTTHYTEQISNDVCNVRLWSLLCWTMRSPCSQVRMQSNTRLRICFVLLISQLHFLVIAPAPSRLMWPPIMINDCRWVWASM